MTDQWIPPIYMQPQAAPQADDKPPRPQRPIKYDRTTPQAKALHGAVAVINR